MDFLRVAWRDISNIFKNRFIRVSVTAIIVVPLLYSLLYLAAFWDPYSKLEKLPVAVVNLDKGGTKDGVPINVGNDLTDNLKKGKQLDFSFKSKTKAEDGLKGKKYYAEFIIPEDFTANMLSGKDGIPKQPNIIYHANMKKNYIASQIINTFKKELQAQITKNMTSLYTKAAFDNLATLKDGMNQGADASKQIKDGVGTLNGYIPELKSGASQLYDGVTKINSNLATAKSGMATLNGGLGQVNAKLPTLVKGTSDAYSGSSTILAGVNTKIKPGANGLAAGLADANTQVPQLTGVATRLKASTAQVSKGVADLADGQAQINAAFDAYKAGNLSLHDLLGALQMSEDKTATSTVLDPLKKGAADSATGASALSDGTNLLATKLGGAAAVAKQLSDGVDGTLVPGLTQLNSGLATMNQSAPVLSSTIGQLYTGSSTISNGVGQLYDGSEVLKNNLGALNGEVPTLVDGASKLVDGTTQLNAKLTDGSNQLNKSLINNSDAMSKFISDSVEIKEDPINEVKNYGTGFAPYFISLSLYVGAMLMFFVITDKVDDDIKASNASLVIGKFFSFGYIGVAQGVLASVVVLMLGLKPNNLPLYFLFIIFMSYVFISINQCFVFLLGGTGRMFAIVLLVLQLTAAGGTFPNELVPSFFKTINPFMPFTYSIQGLREIISGTDYAVLTKDFLVLLGMMIGFLTISVVFKGHANKVQKRIEDKKHNVIA